MDDRTLVKVSAGENCIGFKTISRRRKSGHEFLVTRGELARLENETEVISNDIRSFAVLRRNTANGTVSIHFSWLDGGCNSTLTGWEDTVILPYDALAAFVQASTQEDGPKKWQHLSLCRTSRPKLVFHAQDRLRECLANRTVRKKLSHALRDHFNYPSVEQIIFYHDFEPYSFMFQEVRNGRSGMCGGLIFHNRGDLKKAEYSVHT